MKMNSEDIIYEIASDVVNKVNSLVQGVTWTMSGHSFYHPIELVSSSITEHDMDAINDAIFDDTREISDFITCQVTVHEDYVAISVLLDENLTQDLWCNTYIVARLSKGLTFDLL